MRDRQLIQLEVRNDMDIINQLRLSQAVTTGTNSSQEGTVTTIDNERYVQMMDTNKRSLEILRDRIIIRQEKLGGGEFGVVNKEIYSRSDGHQLSE